MFLILIGKDVRVVMRKVETKITYVCDRCGEEFDQSYCIINVHLPDDLSIAGKEYHFCKKCYKEIYAIMKDKNTTAINFSEVEKFVKKDVYVPMWIVNDWPYFKGPYWKGPYVNTTTTAKWTDGISISAKDINPNNVITTGTINSNDVTACCCDRVRRD